MGNLVSDGTSFSCPNCSSKLKICVPCSPASGCSKKLANTSNSIFPPPGGQCALTSGPCVPSAVNVDPGQTVEKIEGRTGLGIGCKFQCTQGGCLSVDSPGQIVAKHDEALGKQKRKPPAKPTESFYSVAFETKLSPSSYPGVSRKRHYQEANSAFLKAMEGDPKFAQEMQNIGINLKRTPRGLAPRTPPPGWTWHHEEEPGMMQLVPRAQHDSGSAFRAAVHPKGRGGYSIWGKK